MPTPEPTLSERLLLLLEPPSGLSCSADESAQVEATVHEAARLLARLETDPEADHLLRLADHLDKDADRIERNLRDSDARCSDLSLAYRYRAITCRAHARALVELAEAQAKLKQVEAVRDDLAQITPGWFVIPGMVAQKLAAALSAAGGEDVQQRASIPEGAVLGPCHDCATEGDKTPKPTWPCGRCGNMVCKPHWGRVDDCVCWTCEGEPREAALSGAGGEREATE